MAKTIEVDIEGEGLAPISLDAIKSGAMIIISSRKEKKKILIIDDNKFFREALRFKFLDYGVFFADSGEEGIKLVRENHFDLVVTDRQMPGMIGEEVVHFLKDRYPELKVIIMSSLWNDDLRLMAKAAGADRIVEKKEVIKTIEELLR